MTADSCEFCGDSECRTHCDYCGAPTTARRCPSCGHFTCEMEATEASGRHAEPEWMECPICRGNGAPEGDGHGWDGTSNHTPACENCGGEGRIPKLPDALYERAVEAFHAAYHRDFSTFGVDAEQAHGEAQRSGVEAAVIATARTLLSTPSQGAGR